MKFSGLTYKQKNIYLLIGAIVFGFIAYAFSIGDTMQLYYENTALKKQVQHSEATPGNVVQLKKRLAGLDDKLSHYLIDTVKNHEYLLDVVSEFCQRHQLTVKELPYKNVTSEKGFVIETSVLTVEGNFSELLLLVNELETKHKLGRLSSVSFKSYQDNRRKKTILGLVIYLQNIGMNVQKNNATDEKI